MMALCAECMGQVKTSILLNADQIERLLCDDSLSERVRSSLELVRENFAGFAEAFWPDKNKCKKGRACPQCGEIHEKPYALCTPKKDCPTTKVRTARTAEEMAAVSVDCNEDLYLNKQPVCRWALQPIVEQDKVMGHQVLLRLGRSKEYIRVTPDQARVLKSMFLAEHDMDEEV
jgi:hypothetical protein